MTYFSNLICQPHGDGNSADGQSVVPLPTVLERLGIKFDQYELIAAETQSWMNNLTDTLSFD